MTFEQTLRHTECSSCQLLYFELVFFQWITDYLDLFKPLCGPSSHCCPSCHRSFQQRYGLSPVRAQHIEDQVLKGNWKRTRLWIKVINVWIGILLKPSEGGEDVNSSPRSLSLLHVAFVGINEVGSRMAAAPRDFTNARTQFTQLSGYLIVVKDGFGRHQTRIVYCLAVNQHFLQLAKTISRSLCRPTTNVSFFQVICTLETPVGAVTDETLTNVAKKRTNTRDMSYRHSQSDLQDIMSRFWTPTTMSPSSPSFLTASSHTAESTSEKFQFNRAIGSLTWTSILHLTFHGASTAVPCYSCPRGRNRSLKLTETSIAFLAESNLSVGRARFTSDHANSDRHRHRLTTNTEGGIPHEADKTTPG
ncbi:uncharacterized protein BT62DRAFT_1014310 [Guyanagaster necrorhizus]|uniref:Uncharacterized protein n=1 Tax=Guyanagaster necrorhizus TaxID=856835 RepID=A0A9P7VEX2_9AGAR|nr:uncharacterized protein BT62DRAFT_1014310 [Guyanagaster necrorhizus MCA 3950]KAG7439140.1 hypothetical protein BT62DRAFT_1014310 [Guyanagaster necrorhizus MCA 3950]